MDNVFIYWDNSNIFIGAQYVAMEREGQDARSRVYIHFRHLLELAHAGRQTRSTANESMLRACSSKVTPTRWMGRPKWRYLSA